jgi:hypothetical protein
MTYRRFFRGGYDPEGERSMKKLLILSLCLMLAGGMLFAAELPKLQLRP